MLVDYGKPFFTRNKQNMCIRMYYEGVMFYITPPHIFFIINKKLDYIFIKPA
jgi:hypothetical protein